MMDFLKQLISDPPWQAIVFWLCAGEAFLACLVAAFSRSIVRAAYSLFFTLFALAGFYMLLGADFLAISQVVVYIGGILALILFGVLLTNRSQVDLAFHSRRSYAVAGIVAAAVLGLLLVGLTRANWAMVSDLPEVAPTADRLGRLLLSKYPLAFEFISLTLLVALLGASYLVRREER